MLERGENRTRRRREPRRTVPARIAAGVAAVAVVLGLCFLYLVQSVALRDLTARGAAARAALVDVEEVNRTLEFRIEQAFSLDRISRIARERLGMVEPAVVHYVSLDDTDG